VAEMKIGRGGIETGLYAQRLAGGERLLQLGTKLRFLNNFGRAFLDVGELFVDGGKVGMRGYYCRKSIRRSDDGILEMVPSA
jgi:hypothetical protein